MLTKTYAALKGLLSGMGLTLGYFFRPSKVITQQYPENRQTLKLPRRSRSRIELVRDPQTGGFLCVACGVCVKACPNNTIQVVRGKDPVTKKPVLEKFVYHFERCTVCGLCVEACHTEALAMGRSFENAVYDSSQLTMLLNADAPPPPGAPPEQAKAPAPEAHPAPAATPATMPPALSPPPAKPA